MFLVLVDPMNDCLFSIENLLNKLLLFLLQQDQLLLFDRIEQPSTLSFTLFFQRRFNASCLVFTGIWPIEIKDRYVGFHSCFGEFFFAFMVFFRQARLDRLCDCFLHIFCVIEKRVDGGSGPGGLLLVLTLFSNQRTSFVKCAQKFGNLPVVFRCLHHIISKNRNSISRYFETVLSNFKVGIQKILLQYCMSVKTQDTTYLYLQPTHASFYTLCPEEISSSFHQIQLLRGDSAYYVQKKSQVKIRDIMKINKEFKVYGNQLHFYNTVFEVRIKNSTFSILKKQTLTLQLKSQNLTNNSKTRKYTAQINTFINKSEDKENLVNLISLDCLDNQSKLKCNVIVSDCACALAALQEMFDSQQYYQHQKSSKLFLSDLLQTNASSIMKVSTRENFQRTTKTTKNISAGKFVRRTKKKLIPILKQQVGFLSLFNNSSAEKQLTKPAELNSSFSDDPPKIKRITRLRRSMLIPHQIQSQVDQNQFLQNLSQYRRSFTNGLQNLIVVIGVFMIYAMMMPCKRI